MPQIISNILIGDYAFDYVHKGSIKSDWRTMTNTAKLEYPRALKTRDNLQIDQALKIGDAVSISIGYDNNPVQRFTGYVSQIGAATAICEITCEDEMWKLKQTSLTKSWPNTTVDEIIGYIKQKTNATWNYEILGDSIAVDGFKTNKLGAAKVEKLSAAKMLLKLKDDFGIYSFFRNGKLIVGKPYEPDSSKWNRVALAYGQNVVSWKDLTYKRASEVSLKVTCVNHLSTGKKKEIIVGDDTGESRTLDFYNLSDATLKTIANEMLAKLKYDGYRGKIHLLGEPYITDGDVADVTSWLYPERDGSFFVDAVETEFTHKTIKQAVTLGPLATIANT